MSDPEYGPQTVEIRALIERIDEVTPKLARELTREHHASWSQAARDARDAAVAKEWATKRESAWSTKWERTLNTAWMTAWDAMLALTVRDLITPDQFELLYDPWRRVMEGEQPQVCEHCGGSQSLVAEIERRDNTIQELMQQINKMHTTRASIQASMGMEADQLRRRAEKAESECAKLIKLHHSGESDIHNILDLMDNQRRQAAEIEQLKVDLAKFRPIGLVPSTWSDDLPAGNFQGGVKTQMAYIKDGE
jgi:DNA repair exonuclease SbcCD ATPase subunit